MQSTSTGFQLESRKKVICEINSLWPSDAKWRHKSGTTLAQVTACCLTAIYHQYSPVTFIWGQFRTDNSSINHLKELQKFCIQILFKFSRGRWVQISVVISSLSGSVSFRVEFQLPVQHTQGKRNLHIFRKCELKHDMSDWHNHTSGNTRKISDIARNFTSSSWIVKLVNIHTAVFVDFFITNKCAALLVKWSIEKRVMKSDGFVQDCSNSSALALELLKSCTNFLALLWVFFMVWKILKCSLHHTAGHCYKALYCASKDCNGDMIRCWIITKLGMLMHLNGPQLWLLKLLRKPEGKNKPGVPHLNSLM